MSKQIDTENLKEEIKKANAQLPSTPSANVSIPHSSIVSDTQPTEILGQVLTANEPRKSQAKGLIGDIENKSIEAKTNNNPALHGELDNLLNMLGEVKAKIKVLEQKFGAECELIIKHIKMVLLKEPS